MTQHPHPNLGTPSKLVDGGLRIVALGGISEIGRNMTVYETNGKLLIVDCGVLFPEDNQPGIDLILPDFSYIRDRLNDVVGLFLTHGHEDHIGAVPYLLRERGDIPVYSGDDILNLPFLSVGAVGFVSVCGHTVGLQLKAMLDAWFAGNSAKALEIHQQLLPVFTGTFRTQGAILTKAAMSLMGLPGGTTRLPLVDATEAQIEQLRKDLIAGGVTLKN